MTNWTDRLPTPLLAILAIILIQLGTGTAKDLMSAGDALSLLFLRLLAVAVLSTYPFAMEFLALKRIEPRIYGVLLSLKPGIAALIGLLLLGEGLTLRSWLALILVSIASAGVTFMRARIRKG